MYALNQKPEMTRNRVWLCEDWRRGWDLGNFREVQIFVIFATHDQNAEPRNNRENLNT